MRTRRRRMMRKRGVEREKEGEFVQVKVIVVLFAWKSLMEDQKSLACLAYICFMKSAK
ncbi:unnamed protein product [Prunus brigantina]